MRTAFETFELSSTGDNAALCKVLLSEMPADRVSAKKSISEEKIVYFSMNIFEAAGLIDFKYS